MTNSVGRPPKEVNWEVLNAVLQYGATLIDCAEMCDCSEMTIQRAIKKEHDLTFSDYRNKKLGRVRMKLRQKQIEVALEGSAAMLIWLGKNLLDQQDKSDKEIASGVETIEQFIRKINQNKEVSSGKTEETSS